MDVYIRDKLNPHMSYQIPKNKIQKQENTRPWAEMGRNNTEIH